MSLIEEKNKLASSVPFVWLFDLAFGSSTYRFCKNTEDVVYNGNTYSAMPIDIGMIKSDDSGKLNTVSVSISNIGLSLGQIADQLTGGIGSSVTVRLVAVVGDTKYLVFEAPLQIVGARVTEEYVTFELGFKNLLLTKFPVLAFTTGHCQWQFKSAECGYNGEDTSCSKRLEDCKNKVAFSIDKNISGHPNMRPFGGFPFIRTGLRVVR